MKFKIFFLSLIVTIFFSSTGRSAFDLVLDPNLKDAKIIENAKKIFEEVKEVLPSTIKSVLNEPIPVLFKLNSGYEITPFDCNRDFLDTEESVQRARNIWNENTQLTSAIRFHNVIESKLYTYWRGTEIHVNQLFLNVLKGQNQYYSCEHKNFMNLLKANLIHQVARAYDLKTKFSFNESYMNLTDFYTYTQRDEMTNKSETKTASLRRYFPRAEHPYANMDAQANFAYNMEFFLLDPEYKCRKPTLYLYLVDKLNYRPKTYSNCKVFAKMRYARNSDDIVTENNCPIDKVKYMCSDLDFSVDKSCTPGLVKYVCPVTNRMKYYYQEFNLDPAYAYGAQYFKAGPGEGIMSRFGHAAFRLMLCPDYPQHGDINKCAMNDRLGGRRWSNDVVFNFRANTMGLQISQWKGLGFKNGYPTQLFFSNVEDYNSEYNNDELRNLYTLPLVLNETRVDLSKSTDPDSYTFNQSKLQMFAFLGIEKYWGYVSNYNFLTRNCAHEAYEHVKTILDNKSLNHQFATVFGIMTPNGVVGNLSKENLIKKSNAEEILEEKLSTWEQFAQKQNEINERKMDVIDSSVFSIVRSMRFIMENMNMGLDVSTPDKVLNEIKDWINGYEKVDVSNPQSVHDLRFVKVSDRILQNWKMRIQKGEKLSPEILNHVELMSKLGSRTQDIHQWMTFSHLTWLFYLLEQYPDQKSYIDIFENFNGFYSHVSRQLDRESNKTTLSKVCGIINCSDVDEMAKQEHNIFDRPIAMMNKRDVVETASNDRKLKNKLTELALKYYQIQAAKRPFSFLNVKPGYGIPLEDEVYMDSTDRGLLNLNYLQSAVIAELTKLIQQKDILEPPIKKTNNKEEPVEDMRVLYPYAELVRGLRANIRASRDELKEYKLKPQKQNKQNQRKPRTSS